MTNKYILDGKKAVPCEDLLEWGRWMQERDLMRVARDQIGESVVSTVFLGLDHSCGGGPPVLFETMILSGPHKHWQERCSTWEEAEEQHKKAVALVRGEQQ